MVNMEKKSQVAGQIFVYILAIVIVGVILLVGYNAIVYIMDKMNTVGEKDLEQKLRSSVKQTAPRFGTTRVFEFSIPEKYNEICFTDSTDPSADWSSLSSEGYPVIADAKMDPNNKESIFLLQGNHQFGTSFEIEKIHIEKNAKPWWCTDRFVGSSLRLRFVGEGSAVKISLPD